MTSANIIAQDLRITRGKNPKLKSINSANKAMCIPETASTCIAPVAAKDCLVSSLTSLVFPNKSALAKPSSSPFRWCSNDLLNHTLNWNIQSSQEVRCPIDIKAFPMLHWV